MSYINPKYIIVEFLRNRLTDPRSSRSHTSKTNNFTATAGQKEFELSFSSGKSYSCISSVTVAGTTQEKWLDYYINFRDNKVVFFYGLTAGQSVVINLKESATNWIYWDKSVESLTKDSFPRIDVLISSGTGKRLGNYEAPVESLIGVQIDVWTKEKANNQIFTIDGKAYTGESLAEYLAYKIMHTFEDYIDDIHPALYDYEPTEVPPRTMPFNIEMQCFHKVVGCNLKGIELGRL